VRTSDHSGHTRIGSARRALVLLLIACCTAAPAELVAQEMAVPVEVQVPLLVKVLAFDRTLAGGGEGDVVLGILYQGKFRTSANVAEEVRDAVKRLPKAGIGARPLRLVSIDLDDTTNLGAALARQRITVLYVTPLRAADLRDVREACRAGRVITVTGVPTYVETGLAIGIGSKAERPEIVVNLAASRAEGGDLNAQVLKLARIVE
jgi:hypothetical protein